MTEFTFTDIFDSRNWRVADCCYYLRQYPRPVLDACEISAVLSIFDCDSDYFRWHSRLDWDLIWKVFDDMDSDIQFRRLFYSD
jgi:hypothetical protein